MQRTTFLLFLFSICCFLGATQTSGEGPYLKVDFLIIKSTPDYQEAIKFADKAKVNLDLPFQGKEDCVPDSAEGYVCYWECGCGETHEGYLSRGRYDAGNYVSIEHSFGYTEFTSGLYMVMVSSGETQAVKSYLEQAKKFYPDAYIKSATVYVGCLH